MKMTKKILALVFGMLFVIPNAAFAAGEPQSTDDFDYDDAYQWALDVGFSEGFLKDISEDALRRVYYDNIGAENLEIGEETVEVFTFETTPQSRAGTIDEDHMEFRSLPVKHTSGNKVQRVVIYFTAEWLNGRPYQRFTDAIVSNWDASLWNYDPGTFWGKVESVSNGGSGGVLTDISETNPAKLAQGGIGWYASLDNTPLGYTPTIRIGYQLIPRDSNLPTGNRYTSQVDATYGHEQASIGEIALTVSDGSVSMSKHSVERATSCLIEYGV